MDGAAALGRHAERRLAAFLEVDAGRAVGAGLAFRALDETVAATLSGAAPSRASA